MPSLSSKVRSDIIDGKEILAARDIKKAEEFCDDIISAYGIYIDDITSGLDMYISNSNGSVDYLGDLRKVIKKLELFQANDCIPTSSFRQGISINNNNSSINSNTNTNNITNNLEMLFEQTRKEFEDNGFLPPEQIEEILQKIAEIKEVHTSEGNKNSKWQKLREIVKWTAFQGITVAASVLNLITAVVKSTT